MIAAPSGAIRIRFGSKPGTRSTVELTPEEARRLRDYLTSVLPQEPTRQQCDKDATSAAVGAAAMAVEAARTKGKQ
jgi:hypothetical protein